MIDDTKHGDLPYPKDFWDMRFSDAEYIYGKEPNASFKSFIDDRPPGKIFIPGAGEGRDAVYAAGLGWQVYCADSSDAGKEKAMALAAEKGVTITYEVTDIRHATYPAASFDAIASVFFHLPTDLRLQFYSNSLKWLKPGGMFFHIAFTPEQLQNASGGPKDIDLLVSAQSLQSELTGLKSLHLQEAEVILNEGTWHKGKANVVEFLGQNS